MHLSFKHIPQITNKLRRGRKHFFFLRLKNERKKKPAGPDFSTTISRRIELSYHLLSIEENVCDLIIIFAIIPKNS